MFSIAFLVYTCIFHRPTMRVYSSAVEQLIAAQQVPGSNPGGRLRFMMSQNLECHSVFVVVFLLNRLLFNVWVKSLAIL
jgi:hypothetical protein